MSIATYYSRVERFAILESAMCIRRGSSSIRSHLVVSVVLIRAYRQVYVVCRNAVRRREVCLLLYSSKICRRADIIVILDLAEDRTIPQALSLAFLAPPTYWMAFVALLLQNG